MDTFWISAELSMKEKLIGMGITLGPRVGEHWEGCEIPDEAEPGLLGMWGPVMFDNEGKGRRPILDQLLARVQAKGGPPIVAIKRKPARRVL